MFLICAKVYVVYYIYEKMKASTRMDAELAPYGGCRMLNLHVGFRGYQLTPIDEGHD